MFSAEWAIKAVKRAEERLCSTCLALLREIHPLLTVLDVEPPVHVAPVPTLHPDIPTPANLILVLTCILSMVADSLMVHPYVLAVLVRLVIRQLVLFPFAL
jgi:hypothetical protein